MGKTITPANKPYSAGRKLALVTGAAHRIGAAFAVHLASRGYDLILHTNTSNPAATASECTQHGAALELLQADMGNPQAVHGLCASVAEIVSGAQSASPLARHKHLDLLINSAAVFPDSDVGELDFSSLQQCFSVNLFAPLILTQNLPFAADALVVNMLDSRVTRRRKPRLGYSLSKVALAEGTKQLAVMLAPAMRVNALCPGPTLPPPEYGETCAGEKYIEQVAQATPLGQRVGTDDLTRALDYLIDAPLVTGQLLFVDSGEHLA